MEGGESSIFIGWCASQNFKMAFTAEDGNSLRSALRSAALAADGRRRARKRWRPCLHRTALRTGRVGACMGPDRGRCPGPPPRRVPAGAGGGPSLLRACAPLPSLPARRCDQGRRTRARGRGVCAAPRRRSRLVPRRRPTPAAGVFAASSSAAALAARRPSARAAAYRAPSDACLGSGVLSTVLPRPRTVSAPRWAPPPAALRDAAAAVAARRRAYHRLAVARRGADGARRAASAPRGNSNVRGVAVLLPGVAGDAGAPYVASTAPSSAPRAGPRAW